MPDNHSPPSIDERVWARKMGRLRQVTLLLSAALAAIIARTVVDGPTLLVDLTGALMLLLLACSVALARYGRGLNPLKFSNRGHNPDVADSAVEPWPVLEHGSSQSR